MRSTISFRRRQTVFKKSCRKLRRITSSKSSRSIKSGWTSGGILSQKKRSSNRKLETCRRLLNRFTRNMNRSCRPTRSCATTGTRSKKFRNNWSRSRRSLSSSIKNSTRPGRNKRNCRLSCWPPKRNAACWKRAWGSYNPKSNSLSLIYPLTTHPAQGWNSW